MNNFTTQYFTSRLHNANQVQKKLSKSMKLYKTKSMTTKIKNPLQTKFLLIMGFREIKNLMKNSVWGIIYKKIPMMGNNFQKMGKNIMMGNR